MTWLSRFGGMQVTDEPIYKSEGTDGNVKIVNDSTGIPPFYALVPGVSTKLTYTPPLVYAPSPTTEWPQNIANPSDSDIYDAVNDTFIENAILGQVHAWRIQFDYSGKNLNQVVGIDVCLENTLSGFKVCDTVVLPENQVAGVGEQAILITVADQDSLPAPVGLGQGYELTFVSTHNVAINVTNISRISNFHNRRQ